ncbi:hemocyanin F chain isoform X1 [Penaeus vannamei]|uniref:hemocyanin F chain isoform X1 n=1 Tax=Penaeus vannamei TaxID=6689 RepID=UPI00387F9899
MNALAVVTTLVVGLSLQHVALGFFVENKVMIFLPGRSVREAGNEEPESSTSSSASTPLGNELKYLFYLPYESTDILAYRYNLALGNDLEADLKARLGAALSIPRGIPFFFYDNKHAQAVQELIDVFLEANDHPELADIALTVRGHVNEALYIFALYSAVYEMEVASPPDIPSLETVLPDRFINNEVVNEARRLVKAAVHKQNKDVVHVRWYHNQTGLSTRNTENRVAYWREDLFLNTFHWHWHLSNPYLSRPGKIDRRGELFYYAHHNMVARFNMERLSVGLKPVETFEDWRLPLENGYFPHLTAGNGFIWGDRQDDTLMQDIIGINISDAIYISKLELHRSHLLYSIDERYLICENGSQIYLTDDPAPGKPYGINLIGEALEAGASVNPAYYGNIHNNGHMLFGGSNDPLKKHGGNVGVMSAMEISARDSVFYRWHKFVDDVFFRYKMTQPPYTPDQLSVDVEVMEVAVQEDNGTLNDLHTFFTENTIVASHGMDFHLDPESDITVLYTSDFLNHTDFTYNITVNNTKSGTMKPKVRIFLAPKYDENGLPLTYASLLQYWSEMDVFEADPIDPGVSTITRRSSDSSILSAYTGNNANFSFSGCSFPRHLLLPRGKPDGMTFRLFVMVTDADQDRAFGGGEDEPPSFCTFCGIPGAPYPDRWPMGYPLERKSLHTEIDDFVDAYSNMMVIDVNIYHQEEPQGEENPGR